MVEAHDFIPDFVLPSAAGVPTRFYGHTRGTPTVLFVYATSAPEHAALLARMFEALTARAREPLSFVAINRDAPEANQRLCSERGITFLVLSDSDGKLSATLGAGDAITVLVLDPNLRVIDK